MEYVYCMIRAWYSKIIPFNFNLQTFQQPAICKLLSDTWFREISRVRNIIASDLRLMRANSGKHWNTLRDGRIQNSGNCSHETGTRMRQELGASSSVSRKCQHYAFPTDTTVKFRAVPLYWRHWKKSYGPTIIPHPTFLELFFKRYLLQIEQYWYISLTVIGLTPGGSRTVRIYTQTVHRTTQWNRIHRTEQT
jgi:hypothetical protein